MRTTEEGTRKRTERQRGVRTPKDIVLFLLTNIVIGSVMKVKTVMAIVRALAWRTLWRRLARRLL